MKRGSHAEVSYHMLMWARISRMGFLTNEWPRLMTYRPAVADGLVFLLTDVSGSAIDQKLASQDSRPCNSIDTMQQATVGLFERCDVVVRQNICHAIGCEALDKDVNLLDAGVDSLAAQEIRKTLA
eukprot:gnl/MRDRNA2_/MRDRNA2_86667_c0_seq1.p3 gnl/MRDRNA2_/MRDRNA2_86667_c0~~gnl/MRDRNA2_/MRDRNA2_86667_c0_seq1.p3  ORF type:complete len:126 (+),score=14.01 gnl/MRDRNA2_/MRDRNA2_86667_c0_seq1:908-1285(+)